MRRFFQIFSFRFNSYIVIEMVLQRHPSIICFNISETLTVHVNVQNDFQILKPNDYNVDSGCISNYFTGDYDHKRISRPNISGNVYTFVQVSLVTYNDFSGWFGAFVPQFCDYLQQQASCPCFVTSASEGPDNTACPN